MHHTNTKLFLIVPTVLCGLSSSAHHLDGESLVSWPSAISSKMLSISVSRTGTTEGTSDESLRTSKSTVLSDRRSLHRSRLTERSLGIVKYRSVNFLWCPVVCKA